jgi:hypothetical protein
MGCSVLGSDFISLASGVPSGDKSAATITCSTGRTSPRSPTIGVTDRFTNGRSLRGSPSTSLGIRLQVSARVEVTRVKRIVSRVSRSGIVKPIAMLRPMEINAQPNRLDLSDLQARMAKERGIRLVINTGAHRPEELGFMRCGVDQARRSWLEAGDALNTRSLGDQLDAIGTWPDWPGSGEDFVARSVHKGVSIHRENRRGLGGDCSPRRSLGSYAPSLGASPC